MGVVAAANGDLNRVLKGGQERSPDPELVEAGAGDAELEGQPTGRVVVCSAGEEVGGDAFAGDQPWRLFGELMVDSGPEL